MINIFTKQNYWRYAILTTCRFAEQHNINFKEGNNTLKNWPSADLAENGQKTF
jgi:hypothetical protein